MVYWDHDTFSKDLTKLIKAVSFPQGAGISGWDDNITWGKCGGHAGSKTISKVMKKAKEAGFVTLEEAKRHDIPDGSVIGSSNELVKLDDKGAVLARLKWSESYGGVAADNYFYLSLALTKQDDKEQEEQKPTRVPRKSPRKGQGSIPSRPRKARVEAHVGRLAWACMSCREQAGNLGLDVRRRACPVHGKGDHIQRVQPWRRLPRPGRAGGRPVRRSPVRVVALD